MVEMLFVRFFLSMGKATKKQTVCCLYIAILHK